METLDGNIVQLHAPLPISLSSRVAVEGLFLVETLEMRHQVQIVPSEGKLSRLSTY